MADASDQRWRISLLLTLLLTRPLALAGFEPDAAPQPAPPAPSMDADPDAPDEPLALTLSLALSLPAPPPDVTAPPELSELDRHLADAQVARRAGQPDVARAQLLAALLLDPLRPDVLHTLAMTEAYDKRYPAALEHLEAAQALVPADVDIALDRARVLAWSGNLAEAAQRVDAVLAEHAGDAEAWDLRARLHWYQAQPAEAETAARKALALDPLSADFKLTLAQALAAQGQFAAAAELARAVAAERPGDAEVAALLQAAYDNRLRPWRVDLALSHSSFERIPLQDWQGATVQVNRRLSRVDTVYARLDAAHRFGLSDTSLSAGLAHVFRPGWGGFLEATVTPAATFFPIWRVAGGTEFRVRPDQAAIGATFVSVDGSVAHYTTGTSYGLAPGVIQYFDSGRTWISAHLSNSVDTQGHYLNGWGFRVDHLVGADWQVHAGWSHSPETDFTGSRGILAMVRALSLGASWQLNPDLLLRLDYLREDRSNSYIRHELMLGGSYGF